MPADSRDIHPACDKALTTRGHVARGLGLAALLALVLGLLAGCGGDDEPDSIAIDAEIEIATQPDSAVTSATAEQVDSGELDATAAPATTAVFERVRLGDRFEWCPSIQAMWDEFDEAAVALAAAEAEADDAQRALDMATDELDRVEATDVLFTAWDQLDVAHSHYQSAEEQAVEQLHLARGSRTTGTEGVAFERAWEALTTVDPDVLAASELVSLPPAPRADGAPTVSDWKAPESPDAARHDLWQELALELGLFQAEMGETTTEEERLARDKVVKEIEAEVDRQLEERLKEVARRWEEHQTLEALLTETVSGSPAYAAFKESFRESCA